MHPFSVVTLAIFVAGYGTARWDLVTRLYELALFAWDKGVIVSVFGSPILTERGARFFPPNLQPLVFGGTIETDNPMRHSSHEVFKDSPFYHYSSSSFLCLYNI